MKLATAYRYTRHGTDPRRILASNQASSQLVPLPEVILWRFWCPADQLCTSRSPKLRRKQRTNEVRQNA